MNAPEAATVRRYPELAVLIDARQAGWRFLWPDLDGGVPVRLEGFRDWGDGWRDAISIRGRDDVLGVRFFMGVEPPELVWERTGSVSEVAAALLALPVPGDRLAPQLVIGSAPTLWVPS